MIDEENIFDSLEPEDIEISYVGLDTPIKEMNGMINNFFFEIYDVEFSEKKVKEIKEYISNQELQKLILVTEDEIKNGFTIDKIEIGDNTKSILQ